MTSKAVDQLPLISELWGEAYESLKTDKNETTSKLMKDHEMTLEKLMGNPVSSHRDARLKQMADLVRARIQEVEKLTWKIKSASRDSVLSILTWLREASYKGVNPHTRYLPVSLALAGFCLAITASFISDTVLGLNLNLPTNSVRCFPSPS